MALHVRIAALAGAALLLALLTVGLAVAPLCTVFHSGRLGDRHHFPKATLPATAHLSALKAHR